MFLWIYFNEIQRANVDVHILLQFITLSECIFNSLFVCLFVCFLFIGSAVRRLP